MAKTKIIGKVWVVFFKDNLECVCADTSSCLRYFSQWCKDRGLAEPNVRLSFQFIERDVIKLGGR